MVAKKPLPLIQKTMIEAFQCPGCVCGFKTNECKVFKLEEDDGFFRCASHVAGTRIYPVVGLICLGLPKAFARVGMNDNKAPHVRLWENPGKAMKWDDCNVPVWAMELDDYLFVRTFMPRINLSVVDVIKDGTLALCPKATDVRLFVDEID